MSGRAWNVGASNPSIQIEVPGEVEEQARGEC